MKLIRTEKDIQQLEEKIRSYIDVPVEEETLDKTVEYTIQGIISRQLGMYAGMLKSQQQYLDQQVDKLKIAVEEYNGSEVADANLQRADNWVRLQEQKLSFLEELVASEMSSANAAYLAYFGKKWVPWSESRDIANKMKVTAASTDAAATLERLQNRSK